MKQKLSSKEPSWSRKTLDATLKYFFLATERMRMGQVMWYAIDVNERAGYGKSIDRCKLNPVILDLVHLNDVDDLLNGIKKRERNKKVVKRLFEQAFEQGGVLTNADVGGMMRLEQYQDMCVKWKKKLVS